MTGFSEVTGWGMVEFPAGGIEGALLLLGVDAIGQRPALVIDPVVEKLFDGFPS